jgi:hypothetical protein
VYKKLKKEADLEMRRGEDDLKAALATFQEQKEQNTSRIVSSVDALPKTGRGNHPWNYKPVKSMSVIDKIKKEARDARVAQKRNTPMKDLNKKASVVLKAPPQFIEQAKRRATSPPTTQAVIRAPRASKPPLHAPAPRPMVPVVKEEYDIMKDREARLQAMKTGMPADQPSQPGRKIKSEEVGEGFSKPVNVNNAGPLSASFLENEDGDEEGTSTSNKLLKPPPGRQRALSPGRMSPQAALKRKAPAYSPFVSPSKKAMLKPPGGP